MYNMGFHTKVATSARAPYAAFVHILPTIRAFSPTPFEQSNDTCADTLKLVLQFTEPTTYLSANLTALASLEATYALKTVDIILAI